jgi:hypothetical protein
VVSICTAQLYGDVQRRESRDSDRGYPRAARRAKGDREPPAKPYGKTNKKDRPDGQEIFGGWGAHAKQPISERGRKGLEQAIE